MRSVWRLGLLLGIAGVFLLATGALAKDKEELPTVKLVYWRSIDDLPFYVGVEEGFFKEAGINVELQFIKGEQNVLAAVLRNDVACGVMSLASFCKLVEKDVPIKIVSWMGHAHEKTKCGIHVGKQTKYKTLEDIKGMRIGTGAGMEGKTLLRRATALGGYELDDINPLWGAKPDNPMQYEAALRSGGLDAFVV